MAQQLAMSAGTDAAVDTTEADLDEAIRDLTGGAGPDTVFDAVGGDKRYVQRGIEVVLRGGRVGVVGVFPEQRVDRTRNYLRKEVDLVACFSCATWGGVSEFGLALDGLASGELVDTPCITQRFLLKEIDVAFAAAEHHHGQDAIKISIVY